MMPNNYLGIDQSYSGFAVAHLSGDKSTVWRRKFDPKKYSNNTARLLAVEQWLEHLLTWDILDTPTTIAMEGYAMGAKNGREMAGELGYAVKRVLHKAGYPEGFGLRIVPPTSLKKFVTGKGNAKKQEMLLGVYKRWGVEFSDDNEADAYALAQVAKAVREGTDIKFQQEVLNALS